MLCCRIVSNIEPALGICVLITFFHRFTAHLRVLGRLPSTWIRVWSLIGHACQRHPHFQFQFQFQFNNSPKAVSRSSLNFPVLIFNHHFLSLQRSHVPLSGVGQSARPVADAPTNFPTPQSKLKPKAHNDLLPCFEFYPAESWHQKNTLVPTLERYWGCVWGQILESMA